ncbi:MAG: hypothetical protein U1E89_13570 [Burkholderiaceae bacterium]
MAMTWVSSRMRGVGSALLLGLAALVTACSNGSNEPEATRSYAMGVSWFPPRPGDVALALRVADLSVPHIDRALILASVPWNALLDGQSADALVRGNELGLADHYRGKGLDVVVSIDPTDGFDRSRDAPALVARGRSLAEPAVQQLYRSYVRAIDALLRPAALGIASETNLVRQLAAPALYAGLRQAAGDAAAELRAAGSTTVLFVSVQVEAAWGRPAGSYVGVATDRADFAFIAALGLSSYPHLGGYTDPGLVPGDYYSRLVAGSALPVLAIEGGWPSDAGSGVASTPEMQRRYIRRQAALLDAARAIGWYQINFTDLDDAAWPAGVRPFARLGLLDAALQPKPALADWDEVRTRRLQPP